MSFSGSQANNHSWTCWLAAPTSATDWVCAPTSVAWGSSTAHSGLWVCTEDFQLLVECWQGQTCMGTLGGISCCHTWSAALSSVLMAQNKGRVLAVSSWERKGMHVVNKRPQSPQHEHEPGQHGLVPWSQGEALGPALSLGCTALAWGVILTHLSFGRRPGGLNWGQWAQAAQGTFILVLGEMLPLKGNKDLSPREAVASPSSSSSETASAGPKKS